MPNESTSGETGGQRAPGSSEQRAPGGRKPYSVVLLDEFGSDLIEENLRAAPAARKSEEQLKNELLNALRRHLRPEFLSRIDEIVVFHALDRDQIREIVGLTALASAMLSAEVGEGDTIRFKHQRQGAIGGADGGARAGGKPAAKPDPAVEHPAALEQGNGQGRPRPGAKA